MQVFFHFLPYLCGIASKKAEMVDFVRTICYTGIIFGAYPSMRGLFPDPQEQNAVLRFRLFRSEWRRLAWYAM